MCAVNHSILYPGSQIWATQPNAHNICWKGLCADCSIVFCTYIRTDIYYATENAVPATVLLCNQISFLHCVCIAWMVGATELCWMVPSSLNLLCFVVLAYFVASASPNMDVANAALPTYAVTLLFFAGFLFRFSDVPKYWFWYTRIDFLRYSWSALMRNQFLGQDEAVLFGKGKHHVKAPHRD